jgi:hypothetical protein
VGERPQNLDVLMHSPVSTASADQLIEELKRELQEAHRRETATAEILRIISSSPTNMRAVLDMVATRAARLCRRTTEPGPGEKFSAERGFAPMACTASHDL